MQSCLTHICFDALFRVIQARHNELIFYTLIVISAFVTYAGAFCANGHMHLLQAYAHVVIHTCNCQAVDC
jgi:hypothetical protein